MIWVDNTEWWYVRLIWEDSTGWWQGMMVWGDDMRWWYGMTVWDDDVRWWYGMLIWDDDMRWWYETTTWDYDMSWSYGMRQGIVIQSDEWPIITSGVTMWVPCRAERTAALVPQSISRTRHVVAGSLRCWRFLSSSLSTTGFPSVRMTCFAIFDVAAKNPARPHPAPSSRTVLSLKTWLEGRISKSLVISEWQRMGTCGWRCTSYRQQMLARRFALSSHDRLSFDWNRAVAVCGRRYT